MVVNLRGLVVSEQGRATQGVKLIRVDDGDEIAAITKLDVEDEVIAEIETIEGAGMTATDIDLAEDTCEENTTEGDRPESPDTDHKIILLEK